MKKILALLMLFLSLATVPLVAADSVSTNYEITDIEVNGVGWESMPYVERGSTLEIEVTVVGKNDLGTEEVKDVRIQALVGGYEYSTVSVTSDMFDVTPGVTYVKTLYLELPTDMDADQEYSLHVEVYDSNDSSEWPTTDLHISRVRHLLSVIDMLVDNAEAGNFVSTTVVLENMGDFKEEDIKVTVSNEELSISTSTYLAELASHEIDNEDEEDSGEVTLVFQVPADAVTGDYALSVVVEYNRGHSTLEDSVNLHVEGEAVEETTEEPVDNTVVVIVEEEPVEESNDASTALKLGFGILAVLIVILALILIVRR
jgi:hypothetical protein